MKDKIAEFFIETANGMRDIVIIVIKLVALGLAVLIPILLILMWATTDIHVILKLILSAVGSSVAFILFCLSDSLC